MRGEAASYLVARTRSSLGGFPHNLVLTSWSLVGILKSVAIGSPLVNITVAEAAPLGRTTRLIWKLGNERRTRDEDPVVHPTTESAIFVQSLDNAINVDIRTAIDRALKLKA